MTPEQEIQETARRVAAELGPISGLGPRFGYNRESVEWLDDYIERLRASGKFNEDEQIKNLASAFGCFLGECIRAAYGGEWRAHELAWGVFFEDSSAAFPFGKVRRQLEQGAAAGESILQFYNVLPLIRSGKLNKETNAEEPRWKTILKRWFGG